LKIRRLILTLANISTSHVRTSSFYVCDHDRFSEVTTPVEDPNPQCGSHYRCIEASTLQRHLAAWLKLSRQGRIDVGATMTQFASESSALVFEATITSPFQVPPSGRQRTLYFFQRRNRDVPFLQHQQCGRVSGRHSMVQNLKVQHLHQPQSHPSRTGQKLQTKDCIGGFSSFMEYSARAGAWIAPCDLH